MQQIWSGFDSRSEIAPAMTREGIERRNWGKDKERCVKRKQALWFYESTIIFLRSFFTVFFCFFFFFAWVHITKIKTIIADICIKTWHRPAFVFVALFYSYYWCLSSSSITVHHKSYPRYSYQALATSRTCFHRTLLFFLLVLFVEYITEHRNSDRGYSHENLATSRTCFYHILLFLL